MSAMLALAGCEVEEGAGGVEKAVASAEVTIPTPPVSSPTVSPEPTTSSHPSLGSLINEPAKEPIQPEVEAVPAFASVEESLIARYASVIPTKWGERVPGVKTRLHTKKDQVIALTFDACGGKEGSGYDEKLIQYLIQEQIPATLFINARWIAVNPSIFQALASNPLFEIENHGTEHRPLSMTGKLAYGIAGTKNVQEVIHEMKDNADQIEKLTGNRPLFFRSGTAFYDEVAVSVAHDLGFELAGYSVLGDAGATYNTEQVYNAISKASSGSIVLAHMNHPEKDTAEGVIKAIPQLRKLGFSFVQLASMELIGS
ncbi:polysaccharide deacetylase family protein [Paenibacillus sp. Soil766]|uniref:polysaccharide deacetylase family protein n=1 Tax=Paenibacillus sp. Soil766 TaxID=1736404 RepID=UPI001F46E048|nr:polysaccharide deacetylase family protein [Paenibacillus sp. Soil766]